MILKNKILLITWLPWSWKSFFAMFLASFYERIYSNLKIYENWKKRNIDILTMDDIEALDYHETKWLALLEEMGLNANARRWMSNQNLDFIRLGVLSRKKNVDIIIISQLERIVDVVLRELCSASFEMSSYFSKKDYLLFNIEVKNRSWQLVKMINADLIKFTNRYYWTYDTLETSEIRKNNNENTFNEIEYKEKFNKFIENLWNSPAVAI